ncbi:MAG: ferrous iron transport protein B [Bacteroidales bacterium]|nr:ferrous iron transport protein B [Bacteroidales bacterium]
MFLSELNTGESAIILKVKGHGGFRRRIMEMGFVRNKRVKVLLNAPLQDPIKYEIMGYEVSLRRSEASMIEVITEEEAKSLIPADKATATYSKESIEEVITQRNREINVALVGNPNSGKTSLFNAISGSHEHVGNYSGVTVDAKKGECRYRGYNFIITDLPGTYALSAYTPEERYVREHLQNESPDVVINTVVASNLERNLYLTTELIDMDEKIVVSLNMFDELERSGAVLDYNQLGDLLGVPMVPVSTKSGNGVEWLLDTVIEVYENTNPQMRHIHINNGSIIEEGLSKVKEALKRNSEQLPKYFPPRYYALKLLERDASVEAQLSGCASYKEWIEIRDHEVKHIERDLKEDIEGALTNQKYGFISGALKECFTPGKNDGVLVTRIIDTLVTHKLWGFPIFFLLMFLMFYCTFSLGAYPQEWIEAGVEWLSGFVGNFMPEGILKALITDGIIGGVGSVIVFLPNIMILYLFISFMEDSGYLARAAFIMDKIMHKIGLHGKSFIPLVMGFGCNVPVIMATRTIESHSSRLITMMISPFISCSARLPIFILFIGTFFPNNAGLVLFLFYIGGILMAVVTSKLLRRFMFKKDDTPFVMELPPYRVPSLSTTVSHMWDKCKQYLKKMGGLILIASIVIWFLSYFPHGENGNGQPQPSYMEQLGKVCEPVMEPLGMDWKASVAVLSGLPAKEIVVSTLGVLYAEEDGEELSEGALSKKLASGGAFNTASALSFLVFILLYFPCIATVIAIKNESNWKWATLSVLYNTGGAWLFAFITYRIALMFI